MEGILEEQEEQYLQQKSQGEESNIVNNRVNGLVGHTSPDIELRFMDNLNNKQQYPHE